MTGNRLARMAADFFAALTLATLWGSIAQTQFNLAALDELGAEIGFGMRLATTWQDLLGFAPLYAVIVAAVLLVALPVSAALALALPRWRVLLFALGAGAGWLVAIRIIDALVPMPTLIAATRGLSGYLVLALGVALAGALYAWLGQSRPRA